MHFYSVVNCSTVVFVCYLSGRIQRKWHSAVATPFESRAVVELLGIYELTHVPLSYLGKVCYK